MITKQHATVIRLGAAWENLQQVAQRARWYYSKYWSPEKKQILWHCGEMLCSAAAILWRCQTSS